MNWRELTDALRTADDSLSLAYLRCREANLPQTPEAEKMFVALHSARNEIADAVHNAYLVRKQDDGQTPKGDGNDA